MKRKTVFIGTMALLANTALLYGCSGSRSGGDEGEDLRPTDDEITGAVEDELNDRQDLGSDLQVSTKDGIVTLAADVTSLLAEQDALKTARSVRGVRAVVDDLTVTPEERSDPAIEADVKRALSADAATRSYDLGVAVADGIVSLTGSVHSWGERWLASSVVRGVKGVRGIEDYTIVTGERRSDDQIAADVEGRLQADAWIDDRGIDVTVHDGEVTLNGEVGSAIERMRARDDALMVGAKNVDESNLAVQWSLRSDMERDVDQLHMTDTEIQQAVSEAARIDPRVPLGGVSVSVDSGVVTLTGEAQHLQAKLALIEDATNTVGVLGVVDSMVVQGTSAKESSAMVETRVKQALERDPYVDRYDIGVQVADGTVRLTGTVPQRLDRAQAQKVVESLSGVTEVINGIEVDTDAASQTDQEILATIERKIDRNPWLANADVDVGVEDGVATIRGSVHGWFERNLLDEIVEEAGATGVLMELNIVTQHFVAGGQ
jgi:osmotically-inducible protein OsmY